jgi:hypothetical protein
MKTVSIDARAIDGAATFHESFVRAFGFPSWYGRNMEAWVDCMSALDEPDDGLSHLKVGPGEVVVLQIEHASDLKARCPDLWLTLLECTAFVNWRRIESGSAAVLTISAYA